MTTKRVLGLDVSSTTIGYAILEFDENTKDIKLINASYHKPIKDDNIIIRLLNTRNVLRNIFETYRPDYIGIEDIISFMAGGSSANTIITLTSFNRMAALLANDYLNNPPEMFSVMSIRHGIKIDKIFPKKEEIPELVAKHLSIKFPYELNKKGKPKPENNDVADGIAVALYYSLILTDKIKSKKDKNGSKEALNIIGLPKTASEDDFKSKYKELAMKFHPDRYKDDPEIFKKINAAYDVIKDYKSNPNKYDNPFQGQGFRRSGFENEGFGISFEDVIFNIQEQQQNVRKFNFPTINTNIKLSFKECVLGADKEISYKKFIKCKTCNGKGSEAKANSCKNCNGFGRITSTNKSMTYTRVCDKCYGKDIKQITCKTCSNKSVIENNITLNIHIPAGTLNGSTLRLRGAGHFAGQAFFGDAYADAYVYINVEEDPDLKLENENVISEINISLLDALVGCEREVKTIYDPKNIIIPAGTKNKDIININGYGIKASNGMQKVSVKVDYPKSQEELINFLKKGSIMAFTMNCTNKGCGKYQQPILDLKDDQVYCSECGKLILNVSHFAKTQMKALKQTKKPPKPAFSVRCEGCKQECLPKIDNKDKLVCGWCGIVHKSISGPFEILIRQAILKGDQDL